MDEIIELARKEGKYIFIDTYATWCTPCKRMDKIFKQKDVGNFFNDHFINAKFNMDFYRDKNFAAKYEVVFLPTLLFLDPNGNLEYKVDKEISASELIFMGDLTLHPEKYSKTTNEAQKKAPPSSATTPPQDDIRVIKPEIEGSVEQEEAISVPAQVEDSEPVEQILYVLGEGGEIPPEFLKREAYFRMQLMDGSQYKAAEAYLKTQDDWTSEENIRFIYDFLYQTQTREFQFMIENRLLFEELIGADNIQRTINILVYHRLHQGYPRPDLQEAIRLHKLTHPVHGLIAAHRYYLNRLIEEQKYAEYLDLADTYTEEVNPKDDKVFYQKGVIIFEMGTLESTLLKKGVKAIESAIDIQPNESYYFEMLSKLYARWGKEKQARKAAEKAELLAKANN